MLTRKSHTLVILVVITFLLLLAGSLGLRIQTIQCSINDRSCSSEIDTALLPIKGESIFFFDESQLSSLLSSYPTYQIKSYSFQLPSTLKLELAPQRVMYYLTSNSQTQNLGVTDQGLLTSSLPDESVTQVIIPDNHWVDLKTGQNLDAELHRGLTLILSELEVASISVPIILWQDTQTVVLDKPEIPLVLIDPQQAGTNIARLKLLLTEIQKEPLSNQVQEIDVRYKLPVLRNTTTIPRHTSY